MLIVTFFATILPILVYLLIGFLPIARARNVDDYFIFSQTVSTEDYANTSVGYALQMAAIFLFAYWGALYGIGALWTPIFWGIGFWVLIKLLPSYVEYHSRGTTMHEYLAHVFGNSRAVQCLAAIATIVGLLGTAMAEVDYTIQVYAPVLKTTSHELLLGGFFLVFGLIYIIKNGYRAEVITEKFQVPIAYATFIAMLICILPAVWQYSGRRSYIVVAGLLVVALVFLIVGKFRLGWRRAAADPQTYIPLVALVAMAVTTPYVTHLVPGMNASVVLMPLSSQLHAQGFIGIISLFVANALWMPADLSTWQRIASVRGDGLLPSLTKGTWRVLFESPATWILGVVFGITINAAGFLHPSADASESLKSFAISVYHPNVSSGILLPHLLYPLLIVSSVTIMLSTVHCMISAISFTAYNDLVPMGKRASLASARLLTVLLLATGMFGYAELRYHYFASLQTLLYGAYSAQLSLVFVAVLALVKKRICRPAAIASILFGGGGTVLAVLVSLNSTNPVAGVLPPLFAVSFAIVGYIFFYRSPSIAAISQCG